MAIIVDARRAFRAEALPREHGRRGAVRGSSEERPPDGDPPRGDLRPSPAEARRHLPAVLRGVRVLVVDDDEDTMELFAAALAACGAIVATANRAAEALRRLPGRPFDVIVSDIAMPGGDGYWLIEQLRRLPDPRASQVPIVAVTAFDLEHSRARVLAAGFADHLQKPVDPEVLCRAIARALGR